VKLGLGAGAWLAGAALGCSGKKAAPPPVEEKPGPRYWVQILLSGGHASLLGVQAAIQQPTKIPTTLANPFANMATNAKVNERYLQRDLPAYIVSAGLALRGLQ